MQSPIQKIRQSSIVIEKPGILAEILAGNLKTLMIPNYPRVQYILLKLRTCFIIPMSTKGCLRFFFILSAINKNVKNE